MSEITDRFVEALHQVERTRDTQPMLELFADGAVAYNPVFLDGLRGLDGIRQFWQEYADFFVTIETRFTRRLECPGVVVLEWVSEGRLREQGDLVEYGGVTLLTHDGQRVHQLNAYYDTGQLVPLRVGEGPSGLRVERHFEH